MNLTLDEQMEVISSYKQGIPVYVRGRYFNKDSDWKLITGNHIFNFEENHYSINEPKLWIQTLCEEPDINLALAKSVEHLRGDYGYNFTIEVVTKVDDKVESKREAIYLKDIYKLWNLAVEYGRANSFAREQINEENNIFKNK